MGVKGDQQQREEPRAVGGGEVDDDEWVRSLLIHTTQTRLVYHSCFLSALVSAAPLTSEKDD